MPLLGVRSGLPPVQYPPALGGLFIFALSATAVKAQLHLSSSFLYQITPTSLHPLLEREHQRTTPLCSAPGAEHTQRAPAFRPPSRLHLAQTFPPSRILAALATEPQAPSSHNLAGVEHLFAARALSGCTPQSHRPNTHSENDKRYGLQ
ncbi:hypothetical protein FIBSPDRAFT_872006 [Athelia psychrophila]|uniref:Uncharacterized protein n=1 Tax=Athelia psychrophila TaxID=1759441 RepID=A0A165ZV28_9AGAM|nr:hypothetical protein FIBSPDRAFT_872006 [Fibularhizoctonia sp. CBS 109695]